MDKTVVDLKNEIEDFYLNAMIDQGSYINFLDTMANFHKYNLEEQINIFNNAPQNSVAVASENIWKRLGRTLKNNATPIPIIKIDGENERVEYVYDTSDTNEYNPNEVLLWHIDEELDKEYLDANLQGEGTTQNRVQNICMQMSAGYDGSDIEKRILGLSLSYVTLKRMGYDVKDILGELITTQWELTDPEKLLTQVNTDAKSILNPLGTYIRNGRANINDRFRHDNGAGLSGGGRNGGNNGGLGDRGVFRRMGEDQNGISDRGKERNVEESSRGRESGRVSERLSGEVRGEVRENIRTDDEEGRGNGETESRGFNGLASEGTAGKNGGNRDNDSGNQRNDVTNVNENAEQKSVQIGRIDEVENTPISENNSVEESIENHIIQDVYSNFNDDGELETHFIAYNSAEMGENNAFVELEAVAKKHSGYFQESPDDDIPNHFSFKTEEERNAFAVEANAIINSILNPELNKNKEDQKEERQSENTEDVSEEKSVQIGRNDEEEKLNLANEEAAKIVQETIKQIGALPRYDEFAPIDSIEKADKILTEANNKLKAISVFKNSEDKEYFQEIMQDSATDILFDGLFELSVTEDGRFIADLDEANKLKESTLKILEELVRENIATPIKNPFSRTPYIFSFDSEAERKNFIQLVEDKLTSELSIEKKNENETVANNIDETSTDKANFNTNDAVIDYNEIFDKIDNILKDYGEQKIKLAEALEQLENIDNNENVNRNIFITDRITKVSGFLKGTQKEIDDILAGYEKKEYEYAEAFRRFQSLEIDIINKNDQFENISDIMAESGKNAAENSLNIIRAEHEKEFAEQVAEAARINAEREKIESAQTSSTNATPSLFTDDELKATEVKNNNTADEKTIPQNSPFILSIKRHGLFADKTFYEAIISNPKTIEDLQDMQDSFKEIAVNNNGEFAFNLTWNFSFYNEADRDNFVIATNDAINARNAEKANKVAEENSVQNGQDEGEYEYIYFKKDGQFGRELVNNTHPIRNKENMYKVAAEQGAIIISKEEYEKGLAEQRSKIASDRIKEFFREDNIEKIFDFLSNNDNIYSIKAFSELSGISLDRTWKRRKQQLIDYYGEKYTKWQEELETAAREKEQAEKEAQEEQLKEEAAEIGEKYFDYAKNLSPMQRGRINKILGARLRYDDKIQTRAQNIEALFLGGKLAFTYNDFGKTKYAVESPSMGSYYSVTKAEFDYWKYLYENSNVNIKPRHFSTYSHAADEEYVEYHFAYIPKEQASARYQAAADLEEIAKKYGGHLMTGSVEGIESVGFNFSAAENMNNFAQEANAYLDQQYGASTSYGEPMALLPEEKIENNEAENLEEKPVQVTYEPLIEGTIEEKDDNFTLTFTVEEDRYDNYGDLYYKVYPSKKVLRVANFRTLEEIAKKHSGTLYGESFISFDSKDDRNAFIEEVNELIKSKEIDLSTIDYNADMSTTSGKREVFRRNIAAIRLMKELEDENRDATPEERKLLQSYAGFGGMPEAFDSFNVSWSEEYHILLSELTTKEFEEARNSTLNAHYTPDNIVQSIYEGLSSLGFENGYILEPSAGSGKFFQNMPEDMRKNSGIFGVELDSLTARIAAKAYKDVEIANQPFEATNFADGSFDVAISNVPFGDYRITSDLRYRGQRLYIHDYFINKMIDEVRPGGLAIAITSKGTLEKSNVKAREEMARKAELVTAIRLPDDTFKGAGTSAVTDILVFKKREEPLTVEQINKEYEDHRWEDDYPENYGWVYESNRYSHDLGQQINSYYNKNQNNILGTVGETSTPWGKDTTVKSSPDIDVTAKIKEIFANVGKIYEPSKEEMLKPHQTKTVTESFAGFTVENGEVVFHKSDGTIEIPTLNDKQKRRIISAINIRDITKELFKAQRENCSDETLKEHQRKLNQAYEQHNRTFGRLYKDKTLRTYFREDSSYSLLLALEVYDNEGFKGKADIFTKRTISPNVTPTHADSAVDALAISLGETGRIDFPYMQDLTGKTYDELREELEFSSIYQDVDGNYYTYDEFLSGNIRKKMRVTENALRDLEIQEKELFSKIFDGDWKNPPPYNVNSSYEQYIQERIDAVMKKNADTVYRNLGRFDLKPDKDTDKFISNKLKEENNRDFLLFLAGAVQSFDRVEEIKERAKSDPLFVLDVMKYKVADAYYTFSYDGNIGVINECLKIMGYSERDIDDICERIKDTGLNGGDYEWYSFLYDKFSKENPFVNVSENEQNTEEQAKFFENLKNEWEAYKVDYAKKAQPIVEEKFHGEFAMIKSKREWLEKNLSALKEVCPQDIPIESIKVGLGTTFLPPSMIRNFLIEKLELSSRDASGMDVIFEPITNEWKIEGKSIENNVKVQQTYGTSRINALALTEKALNLRTPRITDKVEIDGEERQVLNPIETNKAVMKQEELKKAFKDWVYSNEEYKSWIQNYYNENFNAIRSREYSGEMLKFPGMNPAITLRPHQKDAIAHTLFGENTLLAHAVGAGKTFEMIASAMESKRLGLCNKPMIVVPKHLTVQTGKEFLTLYPDANILVANQKDFEGSKRKEMCSKIATQNWDAVIIGYTQFEKMVITPERRRANAEKQLDELMEAKTKSQEMHGKSHFSVKTLAKMIKSSQEKIAKLKDTVPKDDTIYFEDLGIDRLYVDEAHNFKNLWTYTKMYNVAGINSSSHAGKSQDLLEKVRYIQEINDGGGVIFATGTPVSNSMTEFYTIQKYLQPKLLKDSGLYHFDSWASTFGETTTGIEIAPEGKGFREKTRFSKFNNVPELMTMYKEIADIKTSDMLNLPVPECEYITEQIEPSEAQKKMVDDLADRAALIRNKAVEPQVDNMLKVTNEGRDLALDERNIDPDLPEPADSKVKRCVKNILQVYHDSEDIKGTQLIFCDRSTPKDDGSFSVYDDIRKKLIEAGVKAEEIAFVQSVANSDEKKAALFEKVRRGEVRILLGGTNNLGTGTNVQDRLVATHDLDVPWRPSDLEQRKGRIVRVGNTNSKVKVFRYVTKGTFDSYMWQLIENKQRFISQIMTSKTPTRESEDCDELTLSAAEIKAIATGDPLIREVMEIDNELTRLKMSKSSYLENQEHTRNLLTIDYPIRLKNTKQELDCSLKDKELFEKNTKVIDGVEDFSITINAKTYFDKKEGIKALGEALKSGNRFSFNGEYKGFKLKCVQDDLFGMPKLVMYHMKTYHLDLYSSPEEQLKAFNRLGNTIEKEANKLKGNVENLENAIKVAKEEVEKPFIHEERFKTLENRSIEIREILAAKDKGLESEEEISREIRINRIRKIVQDPSLLPEDEIERQYLSDAAKHLDRYGEENFLTALDDKETFEAMVGKFNYKPAEAIKVIEKLSPNLPSLDYLQSLANDYKENMREIPKVNIAANAI